MKKQSIALGIITVAAIASVLGVTLIGRGSVLTLTEVLSRIDQKAAYAYQMTMTRSGPGPDAPAAGQVVRCSALISPALGARISNRIEDPNTDTPIVTEIYLHLGKGSVTTLLPTNRQYVEMTCDDTQAERLQREHDDPRQVVRQMLACESVRLGRSTVAGVPVEGFQTTDPAYLGESRGDAVDVKLWVDAKTGLPVGMEKTVTLSNDETLHSSVSDIEWHPAGEARQFEPVIPKDYRSVGGGPMAMPRSDERTALRGLKVIADLTGSFPDTLDLSALMAQMKRIEQSEAPAARKLHEQKKTMTKEGRMQRMMEIMAPVQGLSAFYQGLRRQDRDPAYHGARVAPGDKDSVLLRWRASEGVYKVVYGNLRVDRVPSERLAALEAGPATE